MKQDKKDRFCGSTNILPDKDITAKVFWKIITYQPFGTTQVGAFVIVEEVCQYMVAIRLYFQIATVENFMNEYLYKQQEVLEKFMIMSLALTGFFILVLLCFMYLYFSIKKMSEQQIASSCLSVIFRGLAIITVSTKTILAMPVQAIIVVPILFLNSTAYNNNKSYQIAQIVISLVLFFIYGFYTMIHTNMLNLKFLQHELVSSKPNHGKLEYYRPFLNFVFLFLCLQPNLTYIKRTLYSLTLLFFCIFQLFRGAITLKYYNPKLNIFNQVTTFLKVSYILTMLIMNIIKPSNISFVFIYCILCPFVYSAAYLFVSYYNNWLINRIISEKGMSELQYEHCLYILLDILKSKDPLDVSKFEGLIMHYEETIGSDEPSYYAQIMSLLKQQKRFQGRNLLENAYLTDESQDNLQHREFGETYDENSEHEKNIISSRNKRHQSEGNLDVLAEYQNHQLYQCFSVEEANQRRLEELEHNNQQSKFFKINKEGDFDKALFDIKMQFMYNVIIKKAITKYPNSSSLLFTKAYLTMILMENRFLTLTVITHIQAQQHQRGFLDQVSSLISQAYFLQKCMQSGSNSKEQIESDEYMNANLKIDLFCELLKGCSLQIGLFWQILGDQTMSRNQIDKLQGISYDISKQLRQIRLQVDQVNNINNIAQNSTQIFFYLLNFYRMALRDFQTGDQIYKQMLTTKNFVQMNYSILDIDNVGLIVVDGNFNLYGKIKFANRIVLNNLNYQTNELVNKNIKSIMPSEISKMHDKFWKRFSEVGIPKVLEQVRYLYVKDKEGYVRPYRIYIKFLYHYQYGYCFIGTFKKANQLIYEDLEPPVSTNSAFFMITNSQGKIIEISKSCSKLMGLNPYVLDKLHGFLVDDLRVSEFNPAFNISQLDFSKHSSIYLKNVQLNFSIITRYQRELELISTFNEENLIGYKRNNNVNTQCKIVKETYGNENSLVTLYYFLFTVVSGDPSGHPSIVIDNSPSNQNTPFSPRKTSSITPELKGSFGMENSKTRDYQQTPDEDISIFSQQMFMSMGSISDSQLQDCSSQGPINIQSISSSFSTTSKNQFKDIKQLDETQDYEKNPKPLIYLKIMFAIMIIISLGLASILFGLNNQSQSYSKNQQQIMKYSLENEACVTNLLLMTRTFLNINLGLEPQNTTYVTQRKQIIRKMGMDVIETIRTNIKNLKFYDNILQNEESNIFLSQSSSFHDLLSNNSIEVRSINNNYAINLWLDYLNDMFSTDNFTSTVGTFLNKTPSQMNQDQTAFFIITNAENSLVQAFSSFQTSSVNDQINQKNSSAFRNQIYAIISSIIMLSLSLLMAFFVIYVYQMKYKVLEYFAEISKDVIQLCEGGALDYYNLIQTNSASFIKNDEVRIKQRIMVKSMQSSNKTHLANGSNKEQLQFEKQQNKKLDPLAEKKEKMMQRVMKYKVNEEMMAAQGTKKRSQVMEEIKEEDESSMNDSSVLNKSQQPFKKSKTRLSKYNQEDQQEDDEEYDLKQIKLEEGYEYQGKAEFNKVLFQRLKENRMRKLTRYLIVGLLTSLILIAYFCVQYLLFNKSSQVVVSFDTNISVLYQSVQCTSSLIYNIRRVQASNSTTYVLNPTQTINLQRQSMPSIITQLNQSYSECISINQQASSWLSSTYLNDDLQSTIDDANDDQGLCSYIEGSYLNATSCMLIYNKVLTKSISQIASLFLQDAMIYAFKFGSTSPITTSFLMSQINNTDLINLVDANIFYYQSALGNIYSMILNSALNVQYQYNQIMLIIFVIFAGLLVLLFFVMQCHVFSKMRVSVWDSFYILKLLPKEEIDSSMFKKINQFLNKV